VVDANVSSFAGGVKHSLYRKTDGSLWVMGRNFEGQLGDGTTTNRTSPVKVVDGNVSKIAAGSNHSLYRKTDGSLWGMGFNGSGQLNRLIVSSSREALQAVLPSAD
jgi:alpha-tubulin suppressor-like RCC1 family protein